ncbi:hypothetical protein N1030_04275 [Desulfovibrio mangrovi]|uniref:hypothetical protein n=1 Tax=Desulfovibrio mangrovi TaxID=2976983 RepID=UPI0022451B42|nr:hypothetical protein [Desulfovibrio mangrovi]UZP68202.1 hypothetical protein N1030_04275 [Desulfovibrio mangrovi]
MDKTTDYFSEISRSFTHSTASEMISMQAILVLLIVVLVLVGVIIVMWFRSKKNTVYIPHGWVLEPQSIQKNLNEAMELRSKMELQFHSESNRRRSTFCSLYEMSADTVTMECSTLKNISRNWLGKYVDCYFRIQDEHHNPLHYMFTSPIIGIRPVGNDICHLNLAMPNKLELKQKRAALRVDPPDQYIMGIALWPEKLLSDATHDMNFKNWGKPVLSYIPGKRAEIRLVNVSAGGLKLHVKRQNAKECGLSFNIGDRLFVLLDLWEPEAGQRNRYWLLCRLQMPYIDFETRDVDLGLQFMRRAEIVDNSNGELFWLSPLRDNEVDEIGNWAMKRHLELYREKGIE